MNHNIRLNSYFFLILLYLVAETATGQVLWGMLPKGGESGNGTIFSVNYDGSNFTVQHHFKAQGAGHTPVNDLTEVGNKLYGVTREGGVYDNGVLFEYDYVANLYTVKINFSNPQDFPASIMKASNGKLYGRTSSSLFEYNVSTNSLTVLNSNMPFDMRSSGKLIEGSPGKLYGFGCYENFDNHGSIFEYDIATNTLSLKYLMTTNNRSATGALPQGDLFKAPNGKLYGCTSKGGRNDLGVILEFDPATGTVTNKKDFGLNADNSFCAGANPYGSLIQGADGKLYGVTRYGGTWSFGVVFDFDYTTGQVTDRAEFLPYDAAACVGSLFLATDGNMYGVSERTFGDEYDGALFKFDPALNQITTIGSIKGTTSSTPMQASNGKLYFVSNTGGLGGGSLYEYDLTSGIGTVKLYFDDAYDGGKPEGKLTQAYNGKLYGMTRKGGSNGSNGGVLFEFDPTTSVYTKKLDIPTSPEYYREPYSNLILHPNGNLYGVIVNGGLGSGGGIIEFNPTSGVITNTANLADALTYGGGSVPLGGLMIAPNGKMYGMTSVGGQSNGGVIFEYDPLLNKVQKKAEFTSATGVNPQGELVFLNNKFYGVTKKDFSNNLGTLFEFDPTSNIITKKFDFGTLTSGVYPNGSLIASANGYLYGTTLLTNSGGYLGGPGILFDYDPQSGSLDWTQFDTPSGGIYAGLTLLPGGKMVGLSSSTYYTYDPTDLQNSIQHLTIFSAPNGNAASYNFLIALKQAQTTSVSTSPITKTYGDIDFSITASASSGLAVSYMSSNSNVVEVQGSTLKIKGVGNATLTVLQIGDAQYLPAPLKTISITVNKASLTAIAEGKTKTYGDVNPAFTILYSGFVNGENASSIDTSPVASSLATQNSNVGSYPIQLTGGVDNNYSITLTNGTLTVSKSTLAVNADNQSKVYGSSLPILTFSYSGFIGNDSEAVLDQKPTISTSATLLSNTGSYPIELTGGLDNNYSFSLTNGTLTVSKATLTVTADNQTKIYGASIPALTFSYSGFIGNDSETVLDQKPTISTSATFLSNTGSYPIELTGGLDNNYSFSSTNGTLTVSKATLTVTADNQTKVYGASIPALTFSYSGFIGNDSETVLDQRPTISTSATLLSNTGSYPIELTGGLDNNYSFSSTNGTLTVSKATITVTADNQTKVYGASIPALTFSYSGFIGNDSETVLDQKPTISTSATLLSNTGSYPIELTGGLDNNYSFSLTNGVLTITKADQTIAFDAFPEKKSTDAPFELNANASFGLPVSFTSSDVTIAAIQNTTLTIIKSGEILIKASQEGNKNFNAAEVSQLLRIELVTSLMNKEDNIIKIYPNPVGNILTIETSINELTITIIDNLGRQLIERNIYSGHTELNLDILNSGVYFIKMKSNSKTILNQIIIKE